MKQTEAIIQQWFEEQCAKDGIVPHIGNRAAVQDALRQSAAQDLPFSLGQTVREALLRAADAVMQSLDGAELVSCNQNISHFEDDELRPDLILMEPERGDFIIIELKKSHQTARQAITELVAYAQALELLYPGARIAMVLVSPDWRPLLDHAVVNQVISARRKLLALEIAPCASAGFSLRVRIDGLLRNIDDLVFPPTSISADTVTFERRHAPFLPACPIEVTSAFATIAREGDRSGGAGFALLCVARKEWGYQWYVTVMAIEPFQIRLDAEVTSRRWDNPIAAHLRGDSRTKRAPAPSNETPDGACSGEGIPYDSMPEPPDPGAGMALIDTVYGTISDALSRDHDNQVHWAFVQSSPLHRATTCLAFESWGLIGDQIRHNATRFERIDILSQRASSLRRNWNALVNWVPCIDIVTGNEPLPDNLLNVASCHALGVTFRTWITGPGSGGANLERTLANARVVHAVRKIVAISLQAPNLADDIPLVQIDGDVPRRGSILNFIDWLHDEFIGDADLQFAFYLGYRIPQHPRYHPNDTPVYAPAVPVEVLARANMMLDAARRSRTCLGPEGYRSLAEAEIEDHLQGGPVTLHDLLNPRVRSWFLEVVIPHLKQFRHPVAAPVVPVAI